MPKPGRGRGKAAPRRRRLTAGDWQELVAAATAARERAHAPFSGYRVGAALLTGDGRIVTGCNVENASYGLTLCAERLAAFKAVSEGVDSFAGVAVVVDSPRLASPCGPCRQILWEFCGDIPVRMENLRGQRTTRSLSRLLPLPFDSENL